MIRPAGAHGRGPRAVALIVLALAAGAPAHAAAREQPVQGESAIVVDAGSGDVLLADDPDERRPIASTTKLMTALLTLERARTDAVLPASDYVAAPIESQIQLRPGERLSVADLLTALLLESANDAAVALAEGVSGSRAAFVDEMNARARELGLRNTSFANPIGLDDPDNYSSARDLATLTRELLRNERFGDIVDRPRATLTTGARRRVVENRNGLVRRHPFVDGVKTGHTLQAGYVLVGSATARGKRIVSVLLGAPSDAAREAGTLALLRYGIDQYRRVRVLRQRAAAGTAEVKYRDGEQARLVAGARATVTVRRGERVSTRVEAPEELEGPLPAGARVGSITVLYRGRPLETVPLVTAHSIPGAGLPRIVLASLGTPLSVTILLLALAAAGLGASRLARHRRRRVSTRGS